MDFLLPLLSRERLRLRELRELLRRLDLRRVFFSLDDSLSDWAAKADSS